MPTWFSLATGRGTMLCIPRMADWGGFKIGVPIRDPYTPEWSDWKKKKKEEMINRRAKRGLGECRSKPS